MGGEAATQQAVEEVPLKICSLIYGTPADAEAGLTNDYRLIFRFADESWPRGNRYTDPETGKRYFDFGSGDFTGDLSRVGDDKIVPYIFRFYVHESCHALQPYGGPKWIREGICDYVTGKFGAIDQAALDRAQQKHFCHGYSTAALFFEWIEETTEPEFMSKLARWFIGNEGQPYPGGYPQDNTNSSQVFEDITGVPIASLWAQYTNELNIDPPLDCDPSGWRGFD